MLWNKPVEAYDIFRLYSPDTGYCEWDSNGQVATLFQKTGWFNHRRVSDA